MSIDVPPELAWVSRIAAGQDWPRGDEDKLRTLGDIWDETAGHLVSLADEIGPGTQGVLDSLGGAVAIQFQSFTSAMESNLPQMSDAAGKLGDYSRETAVQVEYAKYMILLQLAWLAYEIIQFSFSAPEAIPPAVAGARAIVKLIVQRLLKSVATGIAFNVGMDVLVQTIQLLKGDRTHWDAKNTLGALESGAIGGAVGGFIGGASHVLAPKFTGSLLGKVTIGGASGLGGTVVTNIALGGDTDFGGALSSGLIGGLGGHGSSRRDEPEGGKGGLDLHLPDVHVPSFDELGKPPSVDFGADLGAHTGSGTGSELGNEFGHPSTADLGDGHGAGLGDGTTRSTDQNSTADGEGSRGAGSLDEQRDGAPAGRESSGTTGEESAHSGGAPDTATHSPPAATGRPAELPGFESSPTARAGTGGGPVTENEGLGSRSTGASAAAGSGGTARPAAPGQGAPATGPATRSGTGSGSGSTVTESARPSAPRVSTESTGNTAGMKDQAADAAGPTGDRPGPSTVRTSTDVERTTVPSDLDSPVELRVSSIGELPAPEDPHHTAVLDLPDVPSGPDAPDVLRTLDMLDDLPGIPRDTAMDPLDDLPDVPPTTGGDHPLDPTTPSLRSPKGHIEQRTDELNRMARSSGMAPEQRREFIRAVREAAAARDWPEATRQLAGFRDHVETHSLLRHYDSFRAHVDSGFDRLGALDVSRPEWQRRVDAVDDARRSGDPGRLDTGLRQYTAFIEDRMPPEVLHGSDAPRPFDPRVEDVNRALDTAQDPQEVQELRGRLAELRQDGELRRRLHALTSDGSAERRDETVLHERFFRARTPQEEAQARTELTHHRDVADLQRQLDRLQDNGTEPPPATDDQLRHRFRTLLGADDDPELRRQVDEAPDRQAAHDALNHLSDLRELRQRLNRLRNDPATPSDSSDAALHARLRALTDEDTDPHEAELRLRLDNAPDRQAAYDALGDLITHRELQRRFDRLRDAPATPAGDDDSALHARFDALLGDPRAAELHRQAREATTVDGSRRALDLFDRHQQQRETDRLARIDAARHELDALRDERDRHLADGDDDAFNRTTEQISQTQRRLDSMWTVTEQMRDLHQELSRPLERPEDVRHLDRITDNAVSVRARTESGDGSDRTPPVDENGGDRDTTDTDSLLGSPPDVPDRPAPDHVMPDRVEVPAHPGPVTTPPVASPTGDETRRAPEPGSSQAQLTMERRRRAAVDITTEQDSHDPNETPGASGLDDLVTGRGSPHETHETERTPATQYVRHGGDDGSDASTGDDRRSSGSDSGSTGPASGSSSDEYFSARSRQSDIEDADENSDAPGPGSAPGTDEPDGLLPGHPGLSQEHEYSSDDEFFSATSSIRDSDHEHSADGSSDYDGDAEDEGGQTRPTDRQGSSSRTSRASSPGVSASPPATRSSGDGTRASDGSRSRREFGSAQAQLSRRQESQENDSTDTDTEQRPEQSVFDPHAVPGTDELDSLLAEPNDPIENPQDDNPQDGRDPDGTSTDESSDSADSNTGHSHIGHIGHNEDAQSATGRSATDHSHIDRSSTDHSDTESTGSRGGTAADGTDRDNRSAVGHRSEADEADTEIVTAPQGDEAPNPQSEPTPPPPPAEWHRVSLAGIKITNEPGPAAVRSRLHALLGGHADEQLVRQRLDVQLDPANFRKQHAAMVNGGWRFPLRVGGKPYEVQISATVGAWTRTDTATESTAPEVANDGEGYEIPSGSSHELGIAKTQLAFSEAGLDLSPGYTRSIDPTATANGSVTIALGGAGHTTETSTKTTATGANKVAFTGQADRYTSTFRYEVLVRDEKGTPFGTELMEHQDSIDDTVTADIPRTAEPSGADRRDWEGWEPPATASAAAPATRMRTAPATGQPVAVTGLSAARDAVFAALPAERRPDGLAHQAIVDFFSPENVVNGFQHASSWGLTSPVLTFTKGPAGFLRLTLEPERSEVIGIVDGKNVVGAKSSTEQAGNRVDSSSWTLGGGGGASRQTWHSATDAESAWWGGTFGYNHTRTTTHAAKARTTVSTEESHERPSPAQLVTTRVRFRVELIRHHVSVGTDGLRGSRSSPITLPPAQQDPPRATPPDVTHAPRTTDDAGPHLVIQVETPQPPEVLRLLPRPDLRPDVQAESAPDTAAGSTATVQQAVRPAPGIAELRRPLVRQRTSYLQVPGSADLVEHIVGRLTTQAPGLLPPSPAAARRITPQAWTNLHRLRQRLSPDALRAGARQLLDGTLRITLDSSHLPLLDGRTHEIVIRLDPGKGHHLYSDNSTVKDIVSRASGVDTAVGRAGKHVLTGGGNARRALNPPDTIRLFGAAGVEVSRANAHQVTTGAEREVKREFSQEGTGDAFEYPVGYRVLIGLADPAQPTRRLPDPQPVTDPRVTSMPVEQGQLVLEVRRSAEVVTDRPAETLDRLPLLHVVRDVADVEQFREQVGQTLNGAYRSRADGIEAAFDPLHPDLRDALDLLSDPLQLRGVISSSVGNWANTGDLHVGSGRQRDTVGLSLHTRLGQLHYQETLSGNGKLAVEIKSGTSGAVADKRTTTGKGSVGVDGGLVPETPLGLQTSRYQLRGGVKVKGSYGVDGNDSVKEKMSTSRKLAQKGTWHVYRTDAEITLRGRLTGPTGDVTHGPARTSTHSVLVLLSDADVRTLTTTQRDTTADRTAIAPARRRAMLLDARVAGGAVAEIRTSDDILGEIDRQLRADHVQDGPPLAALHFADTFSPESLAANFDDLLNKGIFDHHAHDGRFGPTVTRVLVRGIVPEDGWRDLGERSTAETTRKVTSARTVKGNAGDSRSLGLDVNVRPSYGTPRAVTHFSSVTWAPGAGGERSLSRGSESGITTKVEHKTSKFGGGVAFGTRMTFEVTVVRQVNGRYVNLPERPRPVTPAWDVKVWVPTSMTRPEEDPPPSPGPLGDRTDWQQSLDSGHDLVGFSRADELLERATSVLTSVRPWGTGPLGRIGAAASSLHRQGRQVVGPAARVLAATSVLGPVLTKAEQVVNSFLVDPRLDAANPLVVERGLSPEQQAALRQALSPQSLAAVFHRLQGGRTGTVTGTGYRTVPLGLDGRTHLVLSLEPTSAAQVIGTRTGGEDELTGSTEDESATTSTAAYSWTASPFDAIALTNAPIVSIPFNSARYGRNQTVDRPVPVTRPPGTPSRTLPPGAVPHDKPVTEPGKAKVSDPSVLLRQQVRITVRRHDHEPYGEGETVTGDLYYWSTRHHDTPAEAEAPALAPTIAVERAAPVAPAPAPVERAAAAPAGTRVDAGISRQHVVEIHLDPDAIELTPRQQRTVTDVADQVAELGARSAEAGGRPPVVTVHGYAEVHRGGLPHFGQSLQLSRQRAQSVADALQAGLGDHPVTLREEASAPVHSEGITVRAHAHGLQQAGPAAVGEHSARAHDRVVLTAEVPARLDADTPPHPPGPQHTAVPAREAAPARHEEEASAEEGTASGADMVGGPGDAVRGGEDLVAEARALGRTTAEVHAPAVRPPVTREQWQHRRDTAPPATRRTERFQASPDALSSWRPGLLTGRLVYVRHTVRRIQADDGRWVRLISFHLPVRPGPGMSHEQLPGFQDRIRALLDERLNTGLLLPRSGDQLHFEATFTHAPDHSEAITVTGPHESRTTAPARANQHYLDLEHTDVDLLHELLHYAGLNDEYRDPDSTRRTPTATDGLMGGTPEPAPFMLPHRHLAEIERISEDGTPLRDHPLPTGDRRPAPVATAHETGPDPLPPDEALTHPAARAPGDGAGSKRQPGDDFRTPRLKRAYTVTYEDESDSGSADTDDEQMAGPSDGQAVPPVAGLDALHVSWDVSTDQGYLDFVEHSTTTSLPLALVINTMTSYRQLHDLPQVIASLTRDLPDFEGRLKIVVGVNAPAGEEAALTAAVEAAQASLSTTVPVELVRQEPFNADEFPFGTMRNQLLDSATNIAAIQEFLDSGHHPYVAFQDFDTSSRATRDGRTHVFTYVEQLLRPPGSEAGSMDIEPADGTTPEFDQEDEDDNSCPPYVERPLMIAVGYRVPGPAEEAQRLRLVEDTVARFENLDVEVPDELTSVPEREAFLEEFSRAIDEDMLIRDWQARIHPLLPYAPEPNLFVDGASLLPHDGERPRVRFGAGGAEFTTLGTQLNRLNAWELRMRYADEREKLRPTVAVGNSRQFENTPAHRLEQGRDELDAQVRAHAENNRLPFRGTAFRTDYVDGAVPTDLSRLAHKYIESKNTVTTSGTPGKAKLLQSHVPLDGVLNRLYESRTAKRGVSLSTVRETHGRVPDGVTTPDEYARTAERLYLPEPGRPKADPTVSWPVADLPKSVVKHLGTRKGNVNAAAISTSLAAPFVDVAAGLSKEHKLLAARELALATRSIQVGRRFAYLRFGPVELTEEVNARHGAAIQRLGNPRVQPIEPPTPTGTDGLYHVLSRVLGTAPPAADGELAAHHAARKVRSGVILWILYPPNLRTVTDLVLRPGVDFESLLNTLAVSGWNGSADDLAPRLVASALNRVITIRRAGPLGQQHEYTFLPLDDSGPDDPITLQVDEGRYTLITG
ncbi:hypothetical protein [Streptomyces sp. NPDC091209]|uniref:WXG100-like domain-containing protein n=1 Tax=Streptomyces sp. NPDC091209 TaxID=3365974 RepID=UPI00381013B8